MMIDWDLYEGGWVVSSYDNPGLFYYLCQIGDWGARKPKELEYFLLNQDFNQTVLLMMSSGNFGGIIWDNLSKQFDLKV